MSTSQPSVMLAILAPCFAGTVRAQLPGDEGTIFVTLSKAGVIWTLELLAVDGLTAAALDGYCTAFGVPDSARVQTTDNGCKATITWEVAE